MNNEELLQKILNSTIERLAKQSLAYEAEIANLNSQIFILSGQIEELNKKLEEKVPKTPAKNDV